MCTVLLRFRPGAAWPVLLAAVRDEFVRRAWDPPAYHWSGASAGLIGGRDREALGTWLAVDPGGHAVAAVLNGARLPLPADGVRPSRGDLPLSVLNGSGVPDDERLNGFHLLRATLRTAEVWSWDGVARTHRVLEPGDHIIVNLGVDAEADPTVTHFWPLLRALPDPVLPAPDVATAAAWGAWVDLLTGDGLDPADPRALLVRHSFGDAVYGSTSATLVALGQRRTRYDFTATPADRGSWFTVHTG
jgi:hypothetical protein